MAVIVFSCIAGKVLLADYRRLLVTGLNLGQPSLIYAYLALLVQSGKHILTERSKRKKKQYHYYTLISIMDFCVHK